MIVAVPPSGPSGVGLGQGWARASTAAPGTGELPWAWLSRLAGPPAAPHAVVTTLRPTTIAIAARIAHPSADNPWTPATPQRFRTRQITADRSHVVRPNGLSTVSTHAPVCGVLPL